MKINCNKYLLNTQRLQHKFFKSFLNIKVGLLIFLLIISCIYQILLKKNHKYKTEETLFNKYPKDIFLDAFVTGIAGVVSVVFVWLSRRMVFEIPFKGVGLLFLIFFTFTLAQEISGFNRYMDRKKIIKGESIYTKMNNISADRAKNIEENGDPFLISCGYFLFCIVFITFAYLVYKMFKYSFCAYKLMPEFNINNIKYLFGTTYGNRYVLFYLEIAIMIIINIIPPLLISPILRKEEKTTLKHKLTSYNFVILSIVVIVIILHIMIQYMGYLN